MNDQNDKQATGPIGPEGAQTPAPEAASDIPVGSQAENPDETIGDMRPADAAPKVDRVDGVMECTLFRASLVNGRYQAQIKCPACDSWVLTDNLECHRDGKGENPVLVAEAVNVICKKQSVPPCGYELGHIRIIGWQHSAPVDWRKEETVAG